MNQIKAHLFWLFRQPQFPTVAIRIISTPIGIDNKVNAFGDFDTLKMIYFRDRFGREVSQFRLASSNSVGLERIINKLQAKNVLINAAIANATKDELITG